MSQYWQLLSMELTADGGHIIIEDGARVASYDIILAMDTQKPPPGVPAIVDRTAEMPINPQPFHPDFVARGWIHWPTLFADRISGITIHHTMSHSPLATARYCAFTKGYPSTQYHFWVSQDDKCPIYQLCPLTWAMWHDHTGAFQTNISVGMAGRLHEHRPPEDQLGQAVRLCAWLMREYDLALEDVRGHTDRHPDRAAGTVCPGWDMADWRGEFYRALRGEIGR